MFNSELIEDIKGWLECDDATLADNGLTRRSLQYQLDKLEGDEDCEAGRGDDGASGEAYYNSLR